MERLNTKRSIKIKDTSLFQQLLTAKKKTKNTRGSVALPTLSKQKKPPTAASRWWSEDGLQ
jgi:hypothetical protein